MCHGDSMLDMSVQLKIVMLRRTSVLENGSVRYHIATINVSVDKAKPASDTRDQSTAQHLVSLRGGGPTVRGMGSCIGAEKSTQADRSKRTCERSLYTLPGQVVYHMLCSNLVFRRCAASPALQFPR